MQTLSIDPMLRLRAGTAAQHEALEASMPFFEPGFSRAGYLHVLSAFLGIFEPLEEQISVVVGGESRLNFDSRRRAPLLRRELLFLGVFEDELDRIPRCTRLPQISDIGSAVGCLYVLEGSALGGQQIARALGPALRLTPENGLSFFSSHGRPVGEMWKSFQTAVRETLTDESQIMAAEEAARQTFVCFLEWMKELDNRRP